MSVFQMPLECLVASAGTLFFFLMLIWVSLDLFKEQRESARLRQKIETLLRQPEHGEARTTFLQTHDDKSLISPETPEL